MFRPRVEELEQRRVPTLSISNLSVTPLPGNAALGQGSVELKGVVQNDLNGNLENGTGLYSDGNYTPVPATISVTGVINGSFNAAANGSFDSTLVATGGGQITLTPSATGYTASQVEIYSITYWRNPTNENGTPTNATFSTPQNLTNTITAQWKYIGAYTWQLTVNFSGSWSVDKNVNYSYSISYGNTTVTGTMAIDANGQGSFTNSALTIATPSGMPPGTDAVSINIRDAWGWGHLFSVTPTVDMTGAPTGGMGGPYH